MKTAIKTAKLGRRILSGICAAAVALPAAAAEPVLPPPLYSGESAGHSITYTEYAKFGGGAAVLPPPPENGIEFGRDKAYINGGGIEAFLSSPYATILMAGAFFAGVAVVAQSVKEEVKLSPNQTGGGETPAPTPPTCTGELVSDGSGGCECPDAGEIETPPGSGVCEPDGGGTSPPDCMGELMPDGSGGCECPDAGEIETPPGSGMCAPSGCSGATPHADPLNPGGCIAEYEARHCPDDNNIPNSAKDGCMDCQAGQVEDGGATGTNCKTPQNTAECQQLNSSHVYRTEDGGGMACGAPLTNADCLARDPANTMVANAAGDNCEAPAACGAGEIRPTPGEDCRAPENTAECAQLNAGDIYRADAGACGAPYMLSDCRTRTPAMIPNTAGDNCRAPENTAECGQLNTGDVYRTEDGGGRACGAPLTNADCLARDPANTMVANAAGDNCMTPSNCPQGEIRPTPEENCRAPENTAECAQLTTGEVFRADTNACGARYTPAECQTRTPPMVPNTAGDNCRAPENTAECGQLNTGDVYRTEDGGGRACGAPLEFNDCWMRAPANTLIPNGAKDNCVTPPGNTAAEMRAAVCNADSNNIADYQRQVFTIPAQFDSPNLAIGAVANDFKSVYDPAFRESRKFWFRGDNNMWEFLGTAGTSLNAYRRDGASPRLPPGTIFAILDREPQTSELSVPKTTEQVMALNADFYRVYLAEDTENKILDDEPADTYPFGTDGSVIYRLAPTDENGRPRGGNLRCAADASANEYFLLTSPEGTTGNNQWRLTEELSEDAVKFRADLGGMLEKTAALKIGNFSFAADAELKNMHAEYALPETQTGAIKWRGYSGVRRINGGETQIVYHKSAAEFSPAENWKLYAASMSGGIKSSRYNNTPLGGFSAGVLAEKIMRHNDSYHVRLNSPFSAAEARRWEFSADVKITGEKGGILFGFYRRLDDKNAGARILYRREF